MIASMTGFGKASYANDLLKITVEVKSINSKQLDLMIRMPAAFREQETMLRNKISPLLERGKVEVCVQYEKNLDNAAVNINSKLIGTYKHQLDNLISELNLPVPNEYLHILLKMPDVMHPDISESSEEENDFLTAAIMEAVENLRLARLNEGKGLYEFFFEKIERIRGYLSLTGKFEQQRIVKIREKLEAQLSKLQAVEIDRGRLEQELIFYIEKLDVSEEKQRLSSHLSYFEETLGSPDETYVTGKGKKLGFISQEIGREINTLGSKSNDADMQKLVVMMKDELEQIKEQVLNVL